MIRRALGRAILLATIATSGGARAGDAALAESLFRQGRELMNKSDFVAACPKLSESFAQDPATGTLLSLALCQERTGATASAWANYAEVVSRAKRDGRADREQAARDHLEALEPRLSKLTIDVAASTASLRGLVVKRDGLQVGSGAWGASSPVDPGEHVVEVTAPGKRAWKASVTIGAVSDSQTAHVPSLDNEPARAAGSAPGSGWPPLRTAGLVVGGAGILGLGLSGYFGLHASSLNTDSKSGGHCDANNTCDAPGLAKRNDAIGASNAATITLVAGGLLAAAGVTLFLVGRPKDATADTPRVETAPAVGPGMAAVLVRGRF